MEEFRKEIHELNDELLNLQSKHNDYTELITKVKSMQSICRSDLKHQVNRMNEISAAIKYSDLSPSEKDALQKELDSRKLSLREINGTLPSNNGLYLNIVIGQVNVSLLSKKDKYIYKEDYERFKLSVTTVCFVYNFILYFFIRNRMLDAAYHFLLVWYYCTLTIREQILVVNGSRIRGWWLASHFIYTALAAILLIWPISHSYDLFRNQFMAYALYMNFVQFIQYYYQKGSLYKLRALGQRHNMDITVDGFMSWMFKNLSFILPLLFIVYIFQLYNSYTLYNLNKFDNKEWQILVVSILFGILGSGNILTALLVIRQKIRSHSSETVEYLSHKYRFFKI